MLIAVEILIIGMMAYSLHFGGNGSPAASGAGEIVHAPAFGAAIMPVAAGPAPDVRIDDPQSEVEVTVSNDGLVHVEDKTELRGWFSSPAFPPLHVARTLGGVQIERANYDSNFIGSSTQEIDVAVPAGARVTIGHCSGAEVRGLHNAVDVASQDGHIGVHDIVGNVVARTDDGHIDADGITADSVTLHSDDGHLSIARITASVLAADTSDGHIDATGLTMQGASPRLTLASDDGSVHASGLFPANGSYDVSSKDGKVQVGLAAGSNVTVDASASDGIEIDGHSYGDDDDSATRSIRVGDGSASMRVRTEDGSVHITTNGVL
jgi:DUF4097 and DUF4098 domain-containing protein YvlB